MCGPSRCGGSFHETKRNEYVCRWAGPQGASPRARLEYSTDVQFVKTRSTESMELRGHRCMMLARTLFLAEVHAMHIVVVNIRVKDARAAEFLNATRQNVRATLKEPGVRRFDLLRESAASSRFLLIEVYDTAEDQTRHKESAHYRRWAEEVEPLLAEPRSRTIYDSCFPQASGWE